MTARLKRSRRPTAIPLGMVMATALVVVPNVTASAAAANGSVASAGRAEATGLSHVVNVRAGHGPSAHVRKAIAEAGGTSPHVAGVAALIKSTHPYAPAALVKALLYAEADATPCTDPYDIDGDGKADAVCEGPRNYNGFYGFGTADALDAVTR